MNNTKDPLKPVLPLAFNFEPLKNESRSSLEFVRMIETAIGSIPPLKITVSTFVDCMNRTDVLRYYFQECTDRELASLGLTRQGYWLRTRPGADNVIISILRVANVLSAACKSFDQGK